MGIFNTFQRNTSNDDLNDPGKSVSEKEGMTPDAGYGIGNDVNTDANPEYSFEGRDGHTPNQTVHGQQIAGTNAFDQDVNRYRQMGQAGQGRGPVTIDQTQGNESRGLEMGALGMLRRQGSGEAPSASAIMADRANQNAFQGAGQQMTAARGTGNRIAAAQSGAQQAGQTALAGNAANAGARAAEISHGQGAYSGGAGAVRGQDIGVATADAQLAAQQRALNEARQQAMEKRGFDVRNTQQQGADRFARNQAEQELARRKLDEAQSGSDWDRGLNMLSTSAKVGSTGGMMSDPKTKADIHPITGSLSSLYLSRKH